MHKKLAQFIDRLNLVDGHTAADTCILVVFVVFIVLLIFGVI